jgi:hypothetical protein
VFVIFRVTPHKLALLVESMEPDPGGEFGARFDQRPRARTQYLFNSPLHTSFGIATGISKQTVMLLIAQHAERAKICPSLMVHKRQTRKDEVGRDTRHERVGQRDVTRQGKDKPFLWVSRP